MASISTATALTPKLVSSLFQDCIRSASTFPANCLLPTANRANPDDLNNYVVRLNKAESTVFLDHENEKHMKGFEVSYGEFHSEIGQSTYGDAYL
jgi:hypothetical protein